MFVVVCKRIILSYISIYIQCTMKVNEIIKNLDANKKVFEALLINKTENEYLWRPEPSKWCLLEIVCHLLDEEHEDFGARVKHCIENPLNELMPIDPVGWVLERDYINKKYNESLSRFLKQRSASVSYLKEHLNSNWDSSTTHPTLGKMSAKLFLTNWLAHDYLHIRQINSYHYLYLKEKTDLNLQYAGKW